LRPRPNLSAAQVILKAAAEMYRSGKHEFSEWDLTIATWQMDNNRFGCRGYESEHPDHKRVMMEIMGKSKADNPVQRGWIKRTRPNFYAITPLGLAQADSLPAAGQSTTSASSQLVHAALSPYMSHRVFLAFKSRGDLPKMWLAVEAFYGISSLSQSHVRSRLNQLRNAIALGRKALDSKGGITPGPVGGGKEINLEDVDVLDRLDEDLRSHFKRQFDVIREKQRS
jgi:hypothetical protein